MLATLKSRAVALLHNPSLEAFENFVREVAESPEPVAPNVLKDDQRKAIFANEIGFEGGLQEVNTDDLLRIAVAVERAVLVAQIQATPLPQSVIDALEFYSNNNMTWITFDPKKREASLRHHRESPDWQEIGEDSRGHERFIVTERKADVALNDLQQWLDEVQSPAKRLLRELADTAPAKVASTGAVAPKKRAADVTEPGVYQWHDENDEHYIGSIERDKRGRLNGTFVGLNSGNIRAVSMVYGSNDYCAGWFVGPIQVAS